MILENKFIQSFKFAQNFNNKKFLITGATGLIGSSIIKCLLSIEENIKIIGVARNQEKARTFPFFEKIEWVFKDMNEEIDYVGEIDYIIHTASPTDSHFFVTNPVETINSAIISSNMVLKLANKKNAKSVFISSMEVYGVCSEDRFIKEDEFFYLNPNNIRNSYAEGKRLVECLWMSYGAEYNLPINIVRLCQTFGEGVSFNDNRVFAQFGKSVICKKNIVLSTKGDTKRSYCSLTDAVNGILLVLLKGENNNVYNLASDNSYYSIYEMAEKFIKGSTSRIVINEQVNNFYLPTIKFGLNTEKIKSLGFESIDSLDSIIDEFLIYYKNLMG